MKKIVFLLLSTVGVVPIFAMFVPAQYGSREKYQEFVNHDTKYIKLNKSLIQSAERIRDLRCKVPFDELKEALRLCQVYEDELILGRWKDKSVYHELGSIVNVYQELYDFIKQYHQGYYGLYKLAKNKKSNFYRCPNELIDKIFNLAHPDAEQECARLRRRLTLVFKRQRWRKILTDEQSLEIVNRMRDKEIAYNSFLKRSKNRLSRSSAASEEAREKFEVLVPLDLFMKLMLKIPGRWFCGGRLITFHKPHKCTGVTQNMRYDGTYNYHKVVFLGEGLMGLARNIEKLSILLSSSKKSFLLKDGNVIYMSYKQDVSDKDLKEIRQLCSAYGFTF